jgi:hypothetical protein
MSPSVTTGANYKGPEMDEVVARQLARQLKILNFWLRVFGLALLIGFIIIGILLYKVMAFTNQLTDRVDNFQQKTERTLQIRKKDIF